MIYLDNAATTKPLSLAIEYANRFLTEDWYNPSAAYGCAVKVRNEIEQARREIIEKIMAEPDLYDLVFTSGGTESDNLALSCHDGDSAVAFISNGEHSAVYETVNEVGYKRSVTIDKYGIASREYLLRKINERTDLVSIMHVNNETGAINNINEIARQVKTVRPDCLFHSDGVQAFGKYPYKLSSDIDMYSISAHKIGGGKGTGALIYKKSITDRITPLIYGGGQERGLRSGTENVFGIMAFRKAVEETYKNIDTTEKAVRRLSDLLWSLLDKTLFTRISPEMEWSPYILTVSLVGGSGQALQAMCEERGLIIGTGAACSTGRENRVLKACGLSSEIVNGAIRLSLSAFTTENEIRSAVEILNECGCLLKI